MDTNEPSSKEAERLKKWREKKKQTNRDNVKAHYEKNKAKVLSTRKRKRLVAKTVGSCSTQIVTVPSTESFFPSRMAKKRALDQARKALPESPRRRVEVKCLQLYWTNHEESCF